MPMWARRNLSVDQVLIAIKENADDIRREAERVAEIKERMYEVADRLESLVKKVTESDA